MKTKEVLSEDFAVDIINLEKYLRLQKGERVCSLQIARSGTSIGANIAEGECAESENDLIHKLSISQKEANETLYWLRILYKSNYISKETFDDLYFKCESLKKILTSIIIKLKNKHIF